MLELMKRREIVVTQDEPWGPIVARATTPDERTGAPAPTSTSRSTSAGVVFVTDELADAGRPRDVGRRDSGPAELTEAQLEALLFVAERPLGRREIAALAGVDQATVDARLGDLEVSLGRRGIRLVLSGDRVELATAPEAGALIARYVGADAIRLSPASLETLAIVAYRQPVAKSAIERIRGVDSDYTIRSLLHRRLVVELGRSDAPGRPFLYGTGFEFLERFGLTSLDELPPLDVDVAARLAEEGGVAVGERASDSGRRRRAGSPSGAGLMAARAPPEGPRRGRRRQPPSERGADRRGPGHGRRPAGDARPAGRSRTRPSSRSTASRSDRRPGRRTCCSTSRPA